MRARACLVQGARPRGASPGTDRGARGEHRGGDRGRRPHPRRRALSDDLRSVGYDLRGAAPGGRHRRHDRGQHRYDHVGLPWTERHGLPGGGREHRDAGRDPQPGRPGDLLGRQSGRIASPAVHSLFGDRERHVHSQREEGPHRRAGRRAAHAERGGGRHLPAGEAAPRLRGPVGAARAREGAARGSGDRSADRGAARHARGPRGPHEGLPLRCADVRHGAVDDARPALQFRRPARARFRPEPIHALRRQAGARPRQRDGRRQRGVLADRVPVRGQHEPRLSALQPRGIHHGGRALPRRGRRGADHSRRSRLELPAGRHRTSAPHSGHRAGPEGNPYQPPRESGDHDIDLRDQRGRNRVPDGRRADHPAPRGAS